MWYVNYPNTNSSLFYFVARRSSFRLPSRQSESRDSTKSHRTNVLSQNIDLEIPDDTMSNNPFVPEIDYHTVDETNIGNLSSRHSDNKTLHSHFSPLPKIGKSRHGIGSYEMEDSYFIKSKNSHQTGSDYALEPGFRGGLNEGTSDIETVGYKLANPSNVNFKARRY